ncbi:unnamed protein product [Sympodiomycopsis kandeliae]
MANPAERFPSKGGGDVGTRAALGIEDRANEQPVTDPSETYADVGFNRNEKKAEGITVPNALRPSAVSEGNPIDSRSKLPYGSPMSISPEDSRRNQTGHTFHNGQYGTTIPRSTPPSTRLAGNVAHSTSLVPPFPPAAASSHLSSSSSPEFESQIQPSKNSYPPTPVSLGADDMIKLASQAALHSVSSALVTQSQTEMSRLAENTKAKDSSVSSISAKMTSPSSSHHGSVQNGPTLNGSISRSRAVSTDDSSKSAGSRLVESDKGRQGHPYTALMEAHMSAALTGARHISDSASRTEPASSTQPQQAPASLAAQVHMATIATKTASEEAERQLRLQALLRASGHTESITSQLLRRVNLATEEEGNRASHKESTAPSSSPDRAPLQRAEQAVPSATPSLPTIDDSHPPALEHIKMPNKGVEQAWGRDEDNHDPVSEKVSSPSDSPDGLFPRASRYYNAADALSGVPSLPLMPAPPLVMLPPPSSFAVQDPLVSTSRAAHSLHYIEGSGAPENSARVEALLTNKPSLDVIQSPNGTAIAGWWIPQARGQGSNAGHSNNLQDQSAMSASTVGGTSDRAAPHTQGPILFQPGGVFDSETYAALATQAAYVTSLLTTTSAGNWESMEVISAQPTAAMDGGSTKPMRPLTEDQYESMRRQLTAWAGLHGPEMQREARDLLEARRINILTGATAPHHLSADSNESADPTDPEQASLFFPPDFASHYKAQLLAIATGVYEGKHKEAFESGQIPRTPPTHDSTTISSSRQADPLHTRRQDTGTAETDQSQRGGSREPGTASDDIAAAILQRVQNLGLSQQAVAAVIDNAAPPQTPVLSEGARDPLQLLNTASLDAGQHATSEAVLDRLLLLAQQLYQSGGQIVKDANGNQKRMLEPTLLGLLHTLHGLHPTHLPTLLLLSCAYYSDGDYAASLYWNDRILSIDPKYVEAMSNIGTTLRALGRSSEAESWWYKAITLRPGYFDAYENLLGVLWTPQRPPPGSSGAASESLPARSREALRLCEFVEAYAMHQQPNGEQVVSAHGQSTAGPPTYLPRHLPASNLPRLQQVFSAKGSLKMLLTDRRNLAAGEYAKVVELACSPSERRSYTLRDLVVATCVIGLVSLGATLGQRAAADGALQVLQALTLDTQNTEVFKLATQAQWNHFHSDGLLGLVHAAGDRLVMMLLRLGGGHLPAIMLKPQHTMQIATILFSQYGGNLPSVVYAARTHNESNAHRALEQCNKNTSAALLTLCKLFQDAIADPAPSKGGALSLGGIPPSPSLVLPLYYLALSLHPTAATCNNMGILLSGLPIRTQRIDDMGRAEIINGQGMAMEYYKAGITLDDKHAHLYTNLGSLLKDAHHLNDAIAQYHKAISINPNFDVALANLANSLRDIKCTEASLTYYRRALQSSANGKMPEALCGLLNALLELDDWSDAFATGGLLDQVVELVEKQLTDGLSYGAAVLRTTCSADAWADHIVSCLGETRPRQREVWRQQISYFYQDFNRTSAVINEGGFLLRLIEFIHRRCQQKWYRDRYGRRSSAPPGVNVDALKINSTTVQDGGRYDRIRLPPALVSPAAPTVLPFHTFQYGIEGTMSPRAIRLISHRNALRITQSSLSQSWLPACVYPPPPPPAPKLNIGYISSDFGHHPLAHLMQSCFGMHDLERFNVFLYATTPADGSPYRQKIESEAQNFRDVSQWAAEQTIAKILSDGIHVLINLNGYTKGARNEIFAARPCPVQMHFMGFAGGMASGWTDYVIADTIVCPPELTSVEIWNEQRRQQLQAGSDHLMPRRPTDLPGEIDPEEPSDSWMYTERFIYMPHSYFVNDYKQGFREPETRESEIDGSVVHPHEMTAEEIWTEEEERRWKARKELFPGLPDDFVVFATFNQLYKVEPTVFKAWLEILKRVPNSILWLLRFHPPGVPNLIKTAREWAGDEVCSRIIFTDIAPKEEHVRRGRVADLFLDTFEVNAHTTACDCLWSGTPIVTLPKWKMKQASLVAASIVEATGYGDQMIVNSVEEYIDRAVDLANGVQYDYVDRAGSRLEPVQPSGPIKASELTRLGASAKIAAQAQREAASNLAQGNGNQSDDAQKAQGDAGSHDEKQKGSTNDDVVPAPVSGPSASAQSSEAAEAAVAPPRESIVLTQVGLQSPPGTVSRRGKGELLELRQNVFVNRESSPLFDTAQWIRDVEKGYLEAWRRWSLGTSFEGSAEWDALSEEEKDKNSGHIYVNRL